MGCGPDNPHGLQLTAYRDGTEVFADVTFDERHIGAPGLAHGGAIAAACDDVLGFTLWIAGTPAVTRSLTVEYLQPVPLHHLHRVRARVEPTPGASELIAAIHARGGRAAVVSGGFHEVLDAVAPPLGVDVWRANRLASADGALTGLVDGEIVDAAAKAASLREWASSYGVPPRRTIAIGDGANDLQMMAAAGLGLAFNAKPAVRAQADLVIGAVDLREVIPLLP